MAVSKVILNGVTLVDLTGDTAVPSDVIANETFHDRSGTSQTGSMITHNVYDGLDSTSTVDALSANKGKELNDKTAVSDRTNVAVGVFLRSASGVNILSFSGFEITNNNDAFARLLDILPLDTVWNIMYDAANSSLIRVGLNSSGTIFLRHPTTGSVVNAATITGFLIYLGY